MMIALTVC